MPYLTNADLLLRFGTIFRVTHKISTGKQSIMRGSTMRRTPVEKRLHAESLGRG
jgi:hypothetical protein